MTQPSGRMALLSRHRLLLVCGICGLLLGARALDIVAHSNPVASTETHSFQSAVRHNLAQTIEADYGLRVLDPDTDIVWVDAPPEFRGADVALTHRFAFLGTPRTSSGAVNRDLYRIDVRVGPSGTVWSPAWLVNLSNSAAADDATITVSGARVVTAIRWNDVVAAVEVRDFSGENSDVTGVANWSFLQRQGDRITNLERTGQAVGIALTHFTVLGTPPSTVELGFDGDHIVVRDPSGTSVAIVDPALGTSSGSLKLGAMAAEQKMPMQFLNWVADRGRGFANQGLAPAWLGTGVELMKEVYFSAGEVKADVEAITEVPHEPTVPTAEVEEAAAEALELARLQERTSNFPWPPAPLEPMLKQRAAGEGIWTSYGPDTIDATPNAPPPFYATFLRPSSRYKRRAVRIVAWDPRHLKLDMRAGTREPIPQTPHKGDGRIPRDNALLSKVVAGFNGGFQTTHTTFGMMVEKQLLLYPRKYGATVGLWEDGRPMFGTWDNGKTIPEGLVSFRQNLQPLLEDGVFNAYHRKRFGNHEKVAGAKDGWTCRSAICYTPAGVLMYFYAEYSNEKTLAKTLVRAGCQYGIHLDMNWGHTGFELYRHLHPSEPLPEDPKASKTFGDLRITGRTPAERVRHMNKPTRYLGVDYRDFFYLVRRELVPGADLKPTVGKEGEGKWLVEELPHNVEFPPRQAWTWRAARSGRSLDIFQLDAAGSRLAWYSTPQDDAEEFDATDLMASLPIAAFAGDGPVEVTVGDVALRGHPMSTVPTSDAEVAVVGLDGAGHLWLVRGAAADFEDIQGLLSERKIGTAIWQSVAERDTIWLYQSTGGEGGSALHGPQLVELLVGDAQGIVVPYPTSETQRLLAFSKPRPSRVIRKWPKANPWKDGRPSKRKKKVGQGTQ